MTAPVSPTRYALVTGASSGLGRAFCLQLAPLGYHIAINGIERRGLEETLRLVENAGGAGRVEECDVTDPAAWQLLRDRLRAVWPRIDLLINNAGMFASGEVGQLDLANTERTVRLNLFGAIYGCNAMIPWLIESAALPKADNRQPSAPHIINVASAYAFVCPPGMAVYNLTKAGVVALSETLAGELRPHGIGVTVVCPGPMPTRFIENAAFGSVTFRRLTERYVRESKLNPDEVAASSLRAAARNQLYVVLGTDQRWYWRLKRWLPSLFINQVAIRVQRHLQNEEVKS